MTKALIICSIIILPVVLLFIIEKLLFSPFKGTGKNWLHHSDFEGRHVVFKSKNNNLNGWFYGENNAAPKGLIIFSHGMGVTSEYYLPEIIYYAAAGYRVFAFDNTGYGTNKGQFLGFSQAVIDLKNAIDYADNGRLPITLIGHSMGGYAVCCVLKYLNLSGHNIKNVLTYAAFNYLPEAAIGFLNARGNFLKMVGVKLICLGQFLIFGKKIYIRASDEVEKNTHIHFIMLHGNNDEEVDINTAALISKNYTNPNVKKIIISTQEINTHMGIVRKNGITDNGVNEEIIKEILEEL